MTEATWNVYDSIEGYYKKKILRKSVDWIHVVVSCKHHNNKLMSCVKGGKIFE
jgi:hypothetical protein